MCVLRLDRFPELDDKRISQRDGPAQEGLWCMERATRGESGIAGNHNCLNTRRTTDPQIRLVIDQDVQLTADPVEHRFPAALS